jgi:peptide/nickel transport system substrate-binding protein
LGIRWANPTRRDLLALAALGLVAGVPRLSSAAVPEGQLTWGAHISLAPTWFDPAETSGIITPFMVLYALHDAMVKPMPGKLLAPSLAESVSAAEDGLTYDFTLRPDVVFHNGDPVTSADVKFSFERYRGASNAMLKARVAAIDTPDPRQVRFRLNEPWPDFLTFYGSATGAGWVVPKKYVEKVGGRGLQEGPNRRRPLQICLVHARDRAGGRGIRAVLAQDAERQTHRHQEHSRRHNPNGGTEAGRC